MSTTFRQDEFWDEEERKWLLKDLNDKLLDVRRMIELLDPYISNEPSIGEVGSSVDMMYTDLIDLELYLNNMKVFLK